MNKNLLALTALAIAALAGCRSSTNTVDPANPVGKPSPEAMAHTITDGSCHESATPIFYNKQVMDSGFTKVQLQVMNNTRSTARLTYKIEWFDKAGMMCTSTAGNQWKPLPIPSGKQETLQAIGPIPEAVDARFFIKESE